MLLNVELSRPPASVQAIIWPFPDGMLLVILNRSDPLSEAWSE